LIQGDIFSINVIDNLTDDTMLKSTSIVRADLDPPRLLNLFPNSIGMASSRRTPAGLMDLLV